MSWLRWEHTLALLVSGVFHAALIVWFQQHPPPAVANTQTLLMQLIPRSWAEQLELSTLPPPPKRTELLPEDDAAPGMLLAGARPQPPEPPPPPKLEVKETPKIATNVLQPVVRKAPELPSKSVEKPTLEPESLTSLSLSKILQELPTETSKTLEPEAPATTVALPDSLLSDLELVALDAPENSQVSLAARRMSVAEARIYRTQLIEFLAEHWEVPPHLADQDMVVEVRFVIERSGAIETGEILRKSGDRFLDRSVQDVLDSLSFLPAVPDSYPDSRYEFFLGFNPSTFPL